MTKKKLTRTLIDACLYICFFALIFISIFGATWGVFGTASTKFPIEIWDGDATIIAWYEMDGHHVVYVKAYRHRVSAKELASLITKCTKMAWSRLRPNHGLYIVVRNGISGNLGFIAGIPYESAQAWLNTDEITPFELIDFETPLSLGRSFGWPEWVEEKTIVWGYAWMIAVLHRDNHPWYAALIYARPLPLDSAFIIRPEEQK